MPLVRPSVRPSSLTAAQWVAALPPTPPRSMKIVVVTADPISFRRRRQRRRIDDGRGFRKLKVIEGISLSPIITKV